jgi:hypothetical protein
LQKPVKLKKRTKHIAEPATKQQGFFHLFAVIFETQLTPQSNIGQQK